MAPYITAVRADELAGDKLETGPWDDNKLEEGSSFGEEGTKTYKSLAQATQIIDRLNYRGRKTDSTQENEFPRGGDTNIPEDIERACFEIALALLDGVDPDIEFENLYMNSQGFANVRSTYERNSVNPYYSVGVPSFMAWKYLQPYLVDCQRVKLEREQ